MRYAALFLIALSGSCGSLVGNLGPPTGPYIQFTSVTVSPTTVRAGSPFAVAASFTYGNCDFGVATASYDNGTQYAESTPGTPLQGSFTAVAAQQTVSFDAVCFPSRGGSPAPRADQSVSITVLPAS